MQGKIKFILTTPTIYVIGIAMKIANNLTTWLAIPGAIVIALGAITKGMETFRYDLLGMARNDEEVFVKHMTSDHLFDNETSQSNSIPVSDGTIIVNVFPDKCVVVKRKTSEGMVTAMKVLPDPEKAEKIKEIYSDYNNGVAYAMAAPFDFGAHAQDCDYKEEKRGVAIVRTYGDGCILRYEFDKYGNSKNWSWVKYNH